MSSGRSDPTLHDLGLTPPIGPEHMQLHSGILIVQSPFPATTAPIHALLVSPLVAECMPEEVGVSLSVGRCRPRLQHLEHISFTQHKVQGSPRSRCRVADVRPCGHQIGFKLQLFQIGRIVTPPPLEKHPTYLFCSCYIVCCTTCLIERIVYCNALVGCSSQNAFPWLWVSIWLRRRVTRNLKGVDGRVR